VSKTGIYHDDLKDWKKKAAADKTWPLFKTFMLAAQKINREMKLNNKQAGYGMAAEQFEFLANLMTATSNANSNGNNKLLTDILKHFDVNDRFKLLVKPVAEGEKKPFVRKDTGSYCHTNLPLQSARAHR
jgi:hypothetical protein